MDPLQTPPDRDSEKAHTQTSAPILAEDRIHLALAASQTAGWDWDLETGRDSRFGDLKTIFGIDSHSHTAHIDDLRRSIHPSDIDAATAAMVHARDNREGYSAEFRIVWPNGTVKWLKAVGKFYYTSEGRPYRMVGVAADITERKFAEEAARKTEDKYRRIIETTMEGITVVDSNFRISFVNPRISEMLGYSVEELLSMNVVDLHFPQHIDKKKEILNRRRRGVSERYDDLMRRKDGSELWVRISATPILNDAGKFDGALAMISDITDQKRAHDALRESERELIEAQRVAQVGSWQWDPTTDVIIGSPECSRIAGRDPRPSAVNFKDLESLYTPESWERLQSAVAKGLQDGTPYDFELQIVRADGEPRWIRTRGEASRGPDRRVTGLHGTIQDITERKHAERTLRESEARFRDLFRNAGVGMVVLSPDGRYLAANDTFCDYLGYTEEELRQLTVEYITEPEDWPSFSDKMGEAISTGANFKRIEKRCRHKSGRTVHTESSASLIRSASGEPQYFVGEVVDVTERKEAEESLADANRRMIEAQEQERARIARDLHDDVNQRLAMLAIELDQLIQESPQIGNLRERLEEIFKRTQDISIDIQSISHQLHPAKIEQLGIVAAVRSFCSESAKRQGVEVFFSNDEVPADIPNEVSVCLFRVLQEALHNAVKHSGARHFEVKLYCTPDGIGVRVSDHGVGFDVASAGISPGLGLTSMRERLRLVQGSLEVQSSLNAGTTIDACVPILREVKSKSAAK